MRKNVSCIVVTIFLCFVIVGVISIFAYYYITTAPDRALASSLKAMSELKTAEYDANIIYEIKIPFLSNSVSIEGEMNSAGLFDVLNQKGDFSFSLDIPTFTGKTADTTTINVIYLDELLYISDTKSNKWTSVTKTQIESLMRQSNFDFSTTGISLLRTKDRSFYKYVAEEALNNKRVYVYDILVDMNEANSLLEKAIDKATQVAETEYSDSLPTGLFNPSEISIRFDRLAFKYKVYKDTNIPAQITMSFDLTVDMGKIGEIKLQNVLVTVNISNIDKEINVIAPESARPYTTTTVLTDNYIY